MPEFYPGYKNPTVTLDGNVQTISNSSAETTILSHTVPGNSMGPNGCVRVTIVGYFIHDTATAMNVQLRIKFGGTTIYSATCASIGTQAAIRRPWNLNFHLFNQDSTGSNTGGGNWSANDTTAVTTGWGHISDDTTDALGAILTDNPAEDTTVDQTLAVTMDMDIADANAQIIVRYKMVEVFYSN